jgi:hypothetical protein
MRVAIKKIKLNIRKMPSFGVLRRGALIRTDVSENRIVYIIRMERVSKLGTLAVTTNQSMVMIEATVFSEMPVRTRATRLKIPDDGIPHVTTVKTSNPT